MERGGDKAAMAPEAKPRAVNWRLAKFLRNYGEMCSPFYFVPVSPVVAHLLHSFIGPKGRNSTSIFRMGFASRVNWGILRDRGSLY